MGFIEEKSDLISEISVVKAIQDNFPNLNRISNTFDSVKSSDGNLITFLLDLLTSLVDSKEIKSEFTRLISKTDSFEEKIKTSIVKNILDRYTRNFDFQLPSGSIMNIPIKNIDLNDTLKTDPNGDLGKYNYGKDSNVDFNRFLYGVTQNGSGTWNGMLDFNFDLNENIEVGVNPSYSNKSFEDFVFDFINSNRLIQPSLLLTSILDNTFGSISSLSDNGEEWLLEQLKLGETVDKIISKESLNDVVTYDNSFFEFDKKALDRVKAKVDGLTNGTHLSDLGCGFGESFIDLNTFEASFNKINDIRPSLVKEATIDFTNTMIDQSTVGIGESDRGNVEVNLLSDIFKNLPSIFLGMSIKPPTILLFQMSESMINGSNLDFSSTSLVNGKLDNMVKLLKDSIVCMVKQIYSFIVEFLFDKVKSELLKLASILANKVLKDQIENYTKILDTVRTLLAQVDNIFSLITG